MATTNKPPRFTRLGSIAEAGAIAAALGGSGDLSAFVVNGSMPFGPTPFLAAQKLLRQSAGISNLIAAAYDDAQTVEDGGVVVEDLENLAPSTIGQAFAALASLSSLALFLLEEHRRGQ